ncbi:MAG: hypothetical protein H0X45_10035 [Planctomycetes bacterium]|nr:hypothetical protein [Planctomycetota bacterium]
MPMRPIACLCALLLLVVAPSAAQPADIVLPTLPPGATQWTYDMLSQLWQVRPLPATTMDELQRLGLLDPDTVSWDGERAFPTPAIDPDGPDFEYWADDADDSSLDPGASPEMPSGDDQPALSGPGLDEGTPETPTDESPTDDPTSLWASLLGPPTPQELALLTAITANAVQLWANDRIRSCLAEMDEVAHDIENLWHDLAQFRADHDRLMADLERARREWEAQTALSLQEIADMERRMAEEAQRERDFSAGSAEADRILQQLNEQNRRDREELERRGYTSPPRAPN